MEQYTKACVPEVQIGTDKMMAKLRLRLDEMGRRLTVKEIKDWLVSQNVKTGIMEEAILDMIEHDIYDVYVEVAKGKEPEQGKDAYFFP